MSARHRPFQSRLRSSKQAPFVLIFCKTKNQSPIPLFFLSAKSHGRSLGSLINAFAVALLPTNFLRCCAFGGSYALSVSLRSTALPEGEPDYVEPPTLGEVARRCRDGEGTSEQSPQMTFLRADNIRPYAHISALTP